MNIQKFTQKSMEAIQDCEKLAYEYGNQEIEQEHLLVALLQQEDGLILKLIEKMEIQKEHFVDNAIRHLEARTKVSGGQVYVGQALNKVLISAEDEAKQRHVMTMKNWIDATDDLLKFRRKEVLNNSGSISHKEAVEKAEKEYEKFRVIQDQKYISSMDEFYKKYLNENKYN